MLTGMLIMGVGAGILNGETAKVGMTVIPAERSGMAAGVGGTVRFAGVVVGFAALGTVLFARVSVSLNTLRAAAAGSPRMAIAQRIVAGDLDGAAAFRGGI
jgi:hypothetical protein